MDDSDRRYNQIIDFVNAGRSKDELDPPIQDEKENQRFDRLAAELAELCKTNPDAMFAHIDSEWGSFDCGYDLD